MKINKDLKSFFKGFFVLALYLISSFFSDFILVLFGIDYSTMPTIFKIIYNISYEILLLSIIVYIYNKEIKKGFKKFIANNKSYFNEYIKYWFLSLGLMFISNLIITFIAGSDTSQNQQQIVSTLQKAPIYTFILTVITAPLLEELVFRLSFRKMFSKTNWLFIITSGLFFGSMHVLTSATSFMDYLYIIPYSIPGFIFAYTLVKSDNIFVPISLHFIHNGIMMTLQILLLILT